MSVLKPDNDRPTAPAARDTAQAKNIKIEILADMFLAAQSWAGDTGEVQVDLNLQV